jgi:hypothetical protein
MDDLPETIGPWSRGKFIEYDEPGMGFSIVYHLEDGSYATITFYAAGLVPDPDGFSYEQILAQFEQAKSDVFEAQSKGTWSSVQHLADDNLALDGEIFALTSFFTLETPGGEELRSMLLLGSSRKRFIKVRISFPVSDDTERETALSLLTDWLFTEVPFRAFKVQ